MASRVLIRHLLRRSVELPPRVVLRKAAGLLRRLAARWLRERRDAVRGTRERSGTGTLGLALGLSASVLDDAERAALRAAAEHYLAHRFDLLGSGWQPAGYGEKAPGIEGVRYPPEREALGVRAGGDPARTLSRPERAAARALLGLVDDPGYRCIDWQRDLRSGFRWSARTPSARLDIGNQRGADIKLPWELSRLQHLPQLALCAILARDGAPGFREPSHYVREIRNQCLDFMALNPPRQGAAWGCPMDVGIRAANLVLAHALLDGAGFEFDALYQRALADSVAEHAAHVAAHVEWSESGRSNHLLGDLAGLVFCAAALPRNEETEGWLAYAASWLLAEVPVQFHPDGGCYEGSTGYHRLSAELVAWPLAVLHGLLATEPGLLARLAARADPGIRGGVARESLRDESLAAVGTRLARMRAFLAAATRPDGALLQVGDMDSGRLFKLVPRPRAGSNPPAEDHLDPGETLDALDALLGGGSGIAGAALRALAGGAPWPLPRPEDAPGGSAGAGAGDGVATPPPADAAGDTREDAALDALVGEARALPGGARRERRVPVPGLDPARLQLELFRDFGLAVARAGGFYAALRCAPHARRDAPTSHLHDDNLALELCVDGAPLITDPGTYVYTPFPELRNAWRQAEAHFAPRASAWSAVGYTDYLFELRLLSAARCLHLSREGMAARLESPHGQVQRIIAFRCEEIVIIDSCTPAPLADEAPPIDCCIGYGIRTARPSAAL